MDLGRLFFGWGWKVRRLRRRWDRLREKTLKKKGAARRLALQKLDSVEPSIAVLEEQKVDWITRTRMCKEIEIALEDVRTLLKSKSEDVKEYEMLRAKKLLGK